MALFWSKNGQGDGNQQAKKDPVNESTVEIEELPEDAKLNDPAPANLNEEQKVDPQEDDTNVKMDVDADAGDQDEVKDVQGNPKDSVKLVPRDGVDADMEPVEPVRLTPKHENSAKTVHLKSADEVKARQDEFGTDEADARHLQLKERPGRSRSTSSSKRYTNWRGTPAVAEAVSSVPNPETSRPTLTPRQKPLTNDLVDP